MPYLCVVTGDDGPLPTIAVELSDEPGAVTIGRAFRIAKRVAGWEVKTRSRGAINVLSEPVCRNPIGSRSWTTHEERVAGA